MLIDLFILIFHSLPLFLFQLIFLLIILWILSFNNFIYYKIYSKLILYIRLSKDHIILVILVIYYSILDLYNPLTARLQEVERNIDIEKFKLEMYYDVELFLKLNYSFDGLDDQQKLELENYIFECINFNRNPVTLDKVTNESYFHNLNNLEPKVTINWIKR